MKIPHSIAATVLLLVVAFSSPASNIAYTIVDLGIPGDRSSQAAGINSSGNVIVNSELPEFGFHAFLFDGTMHELGTGGGLPNSTSTIARGLNNSNQVVGTIHDAAGNEVAYVWDSLHGIQSLGVANTDARAINSAGQVLVNTAYLPSVKPGQPYSYIWDAATGLHPFSSSTCPIIMGRGMNDSGVVVGDCTVSFNGPDSNSRAFRWDAVAGLSLLAPGTFQSIAWTIDNLGNAFGAIMFFDGDSSHAVRWDAAGAMTLLPSIRDSAGVVMSTNAYASNDQGLVVGNAFSPCCGQSAIIWTNSGAYLLDDLITADSGWHLTYALDVNDAGQIVGRGIVGGETHAFRLDPIAPEPPTILPLAFGFSVLVLLAKCIRH